MAANAPGQANDGYDESDLRPADPAAPGLTFMVTRHWPFEVSCACGHRTRYQPPRAIVMPEWQNIGVDRRQWLGPRLAALVVLLLLRLRYRLSRAKLQELLAELLGLEFSIVRRDQTLRQSARQLAPVEGALLAAIEQSPLLHVDETPCPEAGGALWFGAFRTFGTVRYRIGSRAKERFVNALHDGFGGLLMSDGYGVYHAYGKRLRCWVHLVRKARGLAEATCRGGHGTLGRCCWR